MDLEQTKMRIITTIVNAYNIDHLYRCLEEEVKTSGDIAKIKLSASNFSTMAWNVLLSYSKNIGIVWDDVTVNEFSEKATITGLMETKGCGKKVIDEIIKELKGFGVSLKYN